jgi:hypothetical protein
MKLFFHILSSLLLFVFGQTTQAFADTAVKLNLQTECSIVTDNLGGNEEDFLHSEIARTCNFERDFVNYWESDSKSLAKGSGKTKDELINLVDDAFKSYLKRDLDESSELFEFLKSNPVTLSKYKDQILKDIEILKRNITQGEITKIEWHCFDEVEKDAIDNLIKVELKDKSDLFKIIKY